ncbi:MAG: Xaa-Pro peptidase family protein [Dehalobacterium sp.]
MDFKARRKRFFTDMAAKGIENLFIQNTDSIYYLSGFDAGAARTRPYGLLLTPTKEILLSPTTAVDAAREEAQGVEVTAYYEHPVGEGIPMSYYAAIKEMVASGMSGKVIGVENARMSVADQEALNGMGFSVRDVSVHLMRMRSIKEPEELAAIRIAAKYVDFINSATLKLMRPGITEMELAHTGAMELYLKVAEELPGANVDAFIMTTSGPHRTTLPHTNTTMRKLEARDFALFCRQVSINVYRGQADRMGFLGEPTAEQKKYYQIVMNAHGAALEMIRPGVRVGDIDKKVREVLYKEGIDQAKYFICRSGCGVGLNMAEPPYIRFDNDEIAEANMVLIIQPAVYIPDVGGFRCTDTVIVTDSGIEEITKHPRNIEALTV